MAKLRKRGESFQADFFDKQGKRVRKSFTDKEKAITVLEKSGKSWVDETNLKPDRASDDDTPIKFMSKLPRNLLYELRVAAAVRETTISAILEKAVRVELSKTAF